MGSQLILISLIFHVFLYSKVPWGVPTVLLGMIGWLASSVAVGFLAIPQFVKLSGLASTKDFSRPQRAFLLLGVQVLETLVGLSVIWITTRLYEKPESSKLFKISIKKPLETRYGWLVWAIIGILLSIGVNLLVSLILNTLGTEVWSLFFLTLFLHIYLF